MRTRETHINVRTTPQEKAQFERKAKRCGLSLSAYLRMLATGHEPKTVPPLEYRKIYNLMLDVYVDFRDDHNSVAANYLLSLIEEMQATFSPEKTEVKPNGDNKNLGN
jgi:hypothetical protein